MSSVRFRKPAGSDREDTPSAQLFFGRERKEGEEITVMELLRYFCCLIVCAAIVVSLVFICILLYRSIPVKTLSTDCDDSNPCTYDFNERVRGVTNGVCTHSHKLNDAECEDACYNSPKCVSGECLGTCRGHCEPFNAFDCPVINAVNLTALFNFGGTGSDDNVTIVTLYRECVYRTCHYYLGLFFQNFTASSGTIPSIVRSFFGDLTNSTSNSTNLVTGTFISLYTPALADSVCLPLIAEPDRSCLNAIWMLVDQGDATDPFELEIQCGYIFKCANPPSEAGVLPFPVKAQT